MVLQVDYKGRQFKVDIRKTGASRTVRLCDEDVACDWVRLPDGGYSLIIDGKVFDFSVDLDTDTCLVTDRSGTHQLRISDPRRLSTRKSVEEAQTGLRRICADMPGKVIRVLVKPGDPVSYEQALLVLEAMKMQNEIRAPKGGVIKEVGAKPGQAVNTGDFLISLE